MDSELKQYYEEYLSLFAEPGWKYFMEDMRRFYDGADKVSTIKDVDLFKFRQGELSALSHIINWQSMVTNSYDELVKSEAEGAEDGATDS